MSVWGGLIARDVTEMATDGDAEDVAELAEVIGPMLDRYGLAMPSTDATLLEAARRYWIPCPASCRGAVVDLVDTCGVSVGGSGLVIVDDGALAVVTSYVPGLSPLALGTLYGTALYAVNIGAIARIEAPTRDSWCAVLKDGKRVPVSRSGYAKLKELMR